MESREHPRIMSGLDVFDIEGHKIGTVAHLHETGSPAGPTLDDVFEVKTGFFGLGKQYYVPYRAVKDISTSGVFLKRSRLDFDALGWGAKPHAGVRPAPESVRPTGTPARVSRTGAEADSDTSATSERDAERTTGASR
jgi:hypothetical protein